MRDRDAIYQDILRFGRQRAQDAWMRGNRAQAQVEKAHLAVIPGLLHCNDERRHRHYLEVERPRFLRDCRRHSASEFEPFWAELCGVFPPVLVPQAIPVAKLAGPAALDYRGRPDGGPSDA